MEIKKEKQIESLVENGVIIATQEILEREGMEPQKLGEVTRESYGNWESDRQRLANNEPQKIVDAVLAIWGDAPTLDEPENITDEPEG